MEPRSPALQADSLPAEPQGKSKNTGIGRLSLLQLIFLTQESNQGLLHCRWILYQLSYEGSPEEQEIKLPTSVGLSVNQESCRKTLISALLTMPKPLTVWITINCGKFLKRWEYQTTWPASWEIRMQVRKQQLELDMEKQSDSKSGKEYVKAVYCHPAYLTYMQSTSWETLGWMKQKLESRLPRNQEIKKYQ